MGIHTDSHCVDRRQSERIQKGEGMQFGQRKHPIIHITDIY